MLVIRQQQIEAFRHTLERQYLRNLVDWIASEYPALAEGPDSLAHLEQRVGAAYARCRSFDFKSKRDIARFVAFDAKLGPDFENQPGNEWMRAILAHEGLSPATRLYRMECRLERMAAMTASNRKQGNAGSD